MEIIDVSLIDWSRAQFALTAIYHWLFVPLTLGLAVVVGIMETLYYVTQKEYWKETVVFWMRLFGVNFAIGVATGLILEFQFGTNWSNYSWFVGDIFGAPLAIEGIVAFFMESTFVAVMFFGWNKVSRGFHLASTWLAGLGATISAWWILVANAWMQHPVGMTFNPDTARNEMVNFADVALQSIAVNKFFHTVLSSWVVGALFVVGVSCWYLLRNRHSEFALRSIRIGAIVGIVAVLLTAMTGDGSGYEVAQKQPMKLAAMEGLYQGSQDAGLVAVAALNPAKKNYNDSVEPFLFRVEIPYMLSMLANRDMHAFVPGIKDIIEGGYELPDGGKALSAREKMDKGQQAITAFAQYRKAKHQGDDSLADSSRKILENNMSYFGYGYLKNVGDLVPNVPLVFYTFRIMVMLGGYFCAFFALVLFLSWRKRLASCRWLHWVAFLSIPLGYLAGQAGWVVAECGRQPWAIQDILPVNAAVSHLAVSNVQTTFFLFLLLFTILLVAEISIMVKVVRKGPDKSVTES